MSVAPPNFPDLKTGQVESYLHPSVSVPEGLNQNVLVTTVDRLYNWSRRSSMWPLLFGLACCAIEMIATASSRFDLSRFGMEVMRPSPRQSDLMIVSGTVTKKMVPAIVRIYNQMAEPRYVIAMGACATGGGPFKEGYNVVSGIDKYVPVDVYIPGCPPTPEALMFGLMKMHQKVDTQSVTTADWYKREGSAFVPVPQLGPDIFDPRQVDLIRAETMSGAAEAVETDGGRAEGGVPGGLRNLGEKAKARIAQAKERAAARLAG